MDVNTINIITLAYLGDAIYEIYIREKLIEQGMDSLMKGRTTFVIAHRLSTIREADVILVMKDGNIVEQGNHEQLLAKRGFYEELYRSQFAH